MGNLLRFVRGEHKSFRFTVEAVGNTVFFVRRENKPDDILSWDGQPIRGFGHTFPERYMSYEDGVEGSASHQRIISYDFCGLKCLVRFEGDGYLADQVGPEHAVEEAVGGRNVESGRRAGLAIPDISTREGGALIPQHAIVDLKTRSIKTRDQVDEIFAAQIARYWIAQIPFFILAFHERGRFSPEDILVQDIRGEVDKWQDNHHGELRKLGVLLKKLIQLARHSVAERKYEVVCSSPQCLEIRRQGGEVNGPLCEDMREIWLGSLDSPPASDAESEASAGAHVSFDGSDDDAAYSDAESLDYTACGLDCGYCGRCKY